MAEAGLDGLILLSPENFRYATGAEAGVGTMWRRAGAVAVLVPADPDLPEMAVVSDLFAESFRASSHVSDLRESPLWVETADLRAGGDIASALSGRGAGHARPETFDPEVCYRHLAEALAERRLSGRRIGYEAEAISVRDYPALAAALEGVSLADGTDVIRRLKMVKGGFEIAALRLAVEIAETGITQLVNAVVPGVSRDDLAAAWRDAIAEHPEAARLSGAWEYISVGPNPWGGNAVTRPGDLVKVDVGCLVDGYTSDTGRTFVIGAPGEAAARIFEALLAGFEAGVGLIGPGVPLAEVHRATEAAIRGKGLPGFTRGHFGHGLGSGLGSEEWPFISAGSDVVFEPGMVMAFEAPCYVDGVGGLIVENQLLITEDGHEMMNRLPLGMQLL